ncbi:hypothetical protein QCA50_000422 [Cerrena zonata]|uniref:non-specific serine/threonine protein kinase n=1 Tax=Cerrena zonata TaxID=2478898 RepID=A0AAW0GZQ4_9APHY
MVHLSSILPNFVGHRISSGELRYQLLESIGSGAYGVVYLAQDLTSPVSDPRFYAIKCLLRHPNDSDLAKSQEREINLHALSSHHPNVVTLHHVIVDEHYVYFVMDYYSGGDLFGAIMDKGVYVGNDTAVKKTFVQLIDAVEACHVQGIYHRDLKPENILCSANHHQVYLGDFGLASQTESSNTFGCGSSFYMSPECLGVITWRAPYSPRNSDVWSLGVILCNMLTGRNPWHVASPEDRGFAEFLRSGASFLRKALPISRSASRLLTRIFEPDPSVRYTLRELRVAIQAIDTFFPTPDPSNYPHPGPTSVPQLPQLPPADPSMENIILTAPVSIPVPPAAIVRPEPTVDIVVTPFVNQTPDCSPFDVLGAQCVPLLLSQHGSSRSGSPTESRGPPTPVSAVHNPVIVRMSDLVLSSQENTTKSRSSFSKQVLTLTSSGSKLVQRFVDVVNKVKIRT